MVVQGSNWEPHFQQWEGGFANYYLFATQVEALDVEFEVIYRGPGVNAEEQMLLNGVRQELWTIWRWKCVVRRIWHVWWLRGLFGTMGQLTQSPLYQALPQRADVEQQMRRRHVASLWTNRP